MGGHDLNGLAEALGEAAEGARPKDTLVGRHTGSFLFDGGDDVSECGGAGGHAGGFRSGEMGSESGSIVPWIGKVSR